MESLVFSIADRIRSRIQTVGETVHSLANGMQTNLTLDMAEFRRKFER